MSLNAAYGVPPSPYRGALIQLDTADQAILNNTITKIEFNLEVNQFKVNNQKWWLGPAATFVSNFAVDDEVTAVAHGLVTGDGPFRVSTTTSLPGGLFNFLDYWAIRVSDDKYKFATSKANALADSAVDITSNGNGTHTANWGNRLIVPTGVARVRLAGNIRWETNNTGRRLLSIEKNSLHFDGMPVVLDEGHETSQQNVATGVVEVDDDDYFELVVNQLSTVTLDAIQVFQSTWMSIEEVK